MSRPLKDAEERKDRVLFIRLSPKEWAVVEQAIKLRYGKVDGFISEYTRRALLLYARQLIKQARKGRGLK